MSVCLVRFFFFFYWKLADMIDSTLCDATLTVTAAESLVTILGEDVKIYCFDIRER